MGNIYGLQPLFSQPFQQGIFVLFSLCGNQSIAYHNIFMFLPLSEIIDNGYKLSRTTTFITSATISTFGGSIMDS